MRLKEGPEAMGSVCSTFRIFPNPPPPETYIKLLAEKLVEHNLLEGEDSASVAKHIETAHPIGRTGDQLIARFYSRPIRNGVLREAKKNLSRERKALSIAEDMTKVDYEHKKKAQPIMQKAYADGNKAIFKDGKLIVDSQVVPII